MIKHYQCGCGHVQEVKVPPLSGLAALDPPTATMAFRCQACGYILYGAYPVEVIEVRRGIRAVVDAALAWRDHDLEQRAKAAQKVYVLTREDRDYYVEVQDLGIFSSLEAALEWWADYQRWNPDAIIILDGIREHALDTGVVTGYYNPDTGKVEPL